MYVMDRCCCNIEIFLFGIPDQLGARVIIVHVQCYFSGTGIGYILWIMSFISISMHTGQNPMEPVPQ